MKLPSRETLETKFEAPLYDHDVREYHSAKPTGVSLFYKSRLQVCLDTAALHPKGSWILDLACAQANASLLLAEKGYRCAAVDLRPEFLRYARKKYETGIFYPLVGSAENIPFRSRFDVVIAGEIVEHMAYPENLLRECRQALLPDGHLVLSTPNGHFFRSSLPTFGQIKDRELMAKEQFKPDEDGHLFLFSRDELVDLLRKEGFKIEKFVYARSIFLSPRLFRLCLPWMGLGLIAIIDKWVSRTPVLNEFLSEAMIVTARLNPECGAPSGQMR